MHFVTKEGGGNSNIEENIISVRVTGEDKQYLAHLPWEKNPRSLSFDDWGELFVRAKLSEEEGDKAYDLLDLLGIGIYRDDIVTGRDTIVLLTISERDLCKFMSREEAEKIPAPGPLRA